MKIRQQIFSLLVFFGGIFISSAHAFEMIEDAIEGEPKVFFLGKDGNGVIRASKCDECSEIKLTVTPESQAFVGEKEVPLKTIANSSRKPELILFTIKDNKVTRMYWRKE